MCLTPYGIRGFGISALSVIFQGSMWCLTPYGIRGFGIAIVLNQLQLSV